MADNNADLRLSIAEVSRRKQASRQASMDSCDLEQPQRVSLERLTTQDLPEDVDSASPSTPTHCEPVAVVVPPPVVAAERPKPALLKPSLSPRRRITRAEHGGTFNIFHADDNVDAAPKGKAQVVPPYATDPNATFDAPVRPTRVADPVPPTAIDTTATRTPRKPGFPWQWAFTDDQGKPLPEPEMPPYEPVEAPDFKCMSPRTDSYITLTA